jgi:hypothetical protein
MYFCPKMRSASISWHLFVLFSGTYIETLATIVYNPKGSHLVKFFILNNSEISHIWYVLRYIFPIIVHIFIHMDSVNDYQQFYRMRSHWIIYVLANVLMHAPENNINDCKLIMEEIHYYMRLMSEQCTLEVKHFNNFKMIVRAILPKVEC